MDKPWYSEPMISDYEAITPTSIQPDQPQFASLDPFAEELAVSILSLGFAVMLVAALGVVVTLAAAAVHLVWTALVG